jgi:ATP-dependent helicase YprA (DUF1998 family)
MVWIRVSGDEGVTGAALQAAMHAGVERRSINANIVAKMCPASLHRYGRRVSRFVREVRAATMQEAASLLRLPGLSSASAR